MKKIIETVIFYTITALAPVLAIKVLLEFLFKQLR